MLVEDVPSKMDETQIFHTMAGSKPPRDDSPEALEIRRIARRIKAGDMSSEEIKHAAEFLGLNLER